MRRLPTLAIAAGCLAIALLVSLADRCVACSCAQATTLAEAVARDPSAGVFAGRVIEADGRSGVMEVDTWYFGPAPARRVGLRGGDGADCGLPLAAGQHLILVASHEADGRWFAGLCQPSADLDTAIGQDLAREAVATFGPGTPLLVTVPASNPTDLASLAAVAAVVATAGLLLVIGVALAARRVRPR